MKKYCLTSKAKKQLNEIGEAILGTLLLFAALSGVTMTIFGIIVGIGVLAGRPVQCDFELFPLYLVAIELIVAIPLALVWLKNWTINSVEEC